MQKYNMSNRRKNDYQVQVRLSGYLANCLHHLSKKLGMSYTSILTVSLNEYAKDQLTPDEQNEIFPVYSSKREIYDG